MIHSNCGGKSCVDDALVVHRFGHMCMLCVVQVMNIIVWEKAVINVMCRLCHVVVLYCVLQTLGEAVKNPNRSIDDVIWRLKQAFAQVLHWPLDLIHVEKIKVSSLGHHFMSHVSWCVSARGILSHRLFYDSSFC